MTKQQHSLIVHSGGRFASLDEILNLGLPESTDTYTAVGFGDLISHVDMQAARDLPGWTLDRRQYALAPGHGKTPDQRFFFVHSYVSQDSDSDLSLAIAGRSSHDKSISVGLVGGASVFVCDNLALSGEVSVMRKHTGNFASNFKHLVRDFLESLEAKYNQIKADRDLWQSIELNNDQAYQTLGLIYGHGRLSPRQIVTAYEQWREPSHDAFRPRNLWSLYNGCTEAAKTTPFNSAAEALSGLTTHFQAIGQSVAEARGLIKAAEQAPAPAEAGNRFALVDF